MSKMVSPALPKCLNGVVRLNKDEMLNKVNELVGEGKIEGAKDFIAEHKDGLGEYAEKAKALTENFDTNSIIDKVKNLFGK